MAAQNQRQISTAGRLSRWRMTPYLTPEEGLLAVYKYSKVYGEPITNETARLINELCLSDPFFIFCVMRNNYEERDLTTEEGVINTVNYEIIDRESELSETWREYLYDVHRMLADLLGFFTASCVEGVPLYPGDAVESLARNWTGRTR